MEYVDLLCASDGYDDLTSFAKAFCSAANLSEYEERESSNYVGDIYSCAVSGDLKFTMSFSDEQDHRDLPYWIQVSTNAMEQQDLIDFIDQLVRNGLQPAGFHVARVTHLGRKDEHRIDY